MPPPETIALFGATGNTGRHILRLALEQGYQVQAMVRTPSKLYQQQQLNDNNNNNTNSHLLLKVIEGDFTKDDSTAAIQETIAGADYIICTAGGKPGDKKYPPDMMKKFVETLWGILEKENNNNNSKNKKLPKAFLYQSGAFAPKPDGSNPLFLKFMRITLAWMIGLSAMIHDHEQVTKFVATHPKPVNTMRVIVTRPGGLKDGSNSSNAGAVQPKTLEASEDNFEWGMITFQDLAAFTLQAMKDESLDGKYPFIKVAANES